MTRAVCLPITQSVSWLPKPKVTAQDGVTGATGVGGVAAGSSESGHPAISKAGAVRLTGRRR
jgi:hypothetical protein